MSDWHLSPETVLHLLGIVIGVVVTLTTLRVSLKVLSAEVEKLEKAQDADRKNGADQHKENQDAMRDLERRVERECLKKDEFREFRADFNDKIEKLQHTVNNATDKAAGKVLDQLDRLGVVPPRSRPPRSNGGEQ